MDRSDYRTVALADDDPLILALEAWQFISLRTRHCLASYAGDDPAATIAWVPMGDMRLSHLTRWAAIDLLRLPNFGRSCLCEVSMAMERYGFRLKGDNGRGPTLLDPACSFGLARTVPAVMKAMDTRRAGMDRATAMVRLNDGEGMSIRQIAEMHGISRTRVGTMIAEGRPVVALRDRYPLRAVVHP